VALHIEKYVSSVKETLLQNKKDVYGGCIKSVFSFRMDGPLKYVTGVAHKLNSYLRSSSSSSSSMEQFIAASTKI
jgi:hypothetical protein